MAVQLIDRLHSLHLLHSADDRGITFRRYPTFTRRVNKRDRDASCACYSHIIRRKASITELKYGAVDYLKLQLHGPILL